MVVCVIGLGSMGKRRIRLLRKYQSEYIVIGVDNNDERRKSCEEEFHIMTYQNIAEAITSEHIDCSFVCTSPLSHSEIIILCLNNDLHVFTELNLVEDGYEEIIRLAKEKNKVLFMSSTFLYRNEINMIKHTLQQIDSRMNYVYHIGQYLPDWHPWENYQDFFVGNKRTNGCREIFAIELPWLLETFGEIKDVNVVKSKNSNLNIDYNDNYLLIIQHESGHKGCLAVDIVSRKAVRNLEVFGEQLYLRWDGSPTGLFTYDFVTKKDVNIKLYEDIDRLDNYSSFIIENAYMNEISSFFETIINGKEMIYDFEKDKHVLKIIDRIEAI